MRKATLNVVRALVIILSIGGGVRGVSAASPVSAGQWPSGPTEGIAAAGGLAVYGAGSALQTADVSTPAAPVVLGEVKIGGFVQSVAIAGERAYVAAAQAGLVVVDLSDPVHPSVLGSLPDTQYAQSVVVRGSIAWVCGSSQGLSAVDIADPANPQLLSSTKEGLSRARQVIAAGDTLLVADSSEGLVIFDGSDPSSPLLVGSLDGRYRGVDATGSYAYLPSYSGTVVDVVNISDPSKPTTTTSIDLGASGLYSSLVAGNQLLVSGINLGLVAFDLADPAAPVEAGRLEGVWGKLSVDSDDLYIARSYAGWAVAELAASGAPVLLATHGGTGSSTRLAVAGSVAVVAARPDFIGVDIADPKQPRELWRIRPAGVPEDVAAANGLIYASVDHGLLVLDCGRPGPPRKLGWTPLSATGRYISAEGDLVAMAAFYSSAFIAVDVRDPANPRETGRIDFGFRPLGVVLSGDTAYLAEGGQGLHIIDLGDPASPSDVGMIELEGVSASLAVRDGLLFVGLSRSGVAIFDISDPLHPAELGRWTGASYSGGLVPAGNILGVASIYSGFFAVDISDPSHPQTVGSAAMLQYAETNAWGQGNLVAVPEEEVGIEIFDLAEFSESAPQARFTVAPGTPVAGTAARLADTSTGGITSWSWDFGDGETSSLRNPGHTWSTAGTFEVSLTVTGPGGSDTATRTVTVRAPGGSGVADPGLYSWIISGSAHISGAHGTSWVTDVVLHNPRPGDAVATLYFLPSGQDGSAATGFTVTVPASSSVTLSDVVATLFGKASASGAILVGCDNRLLVSSRTYNNAASGTYGQFVPGIPASGALFTGEEARLIQLTRDSEYRTNIGFANASGRTITVDVHLFASDGSKLGNRSFDLAPYSFHQETDIIGQDAAGAWAQITSSTGGASFFTYASVIDNRTGDPVFVTTGVRPISPGESAYIPGSAHVTGTGGTQWRTDLEVLNLDTQTATFAIDILERNHRNDAPVSKTLTLESGRTMRSNDALSSLFGFTGAAALRIRPLAGLIMVTSRTFNQASKGTYGQFIAAEPGDASFAAGESATLIQLADSASSSSGYRTNIGLVNTSGASITVTVDLRNGGGAHLGTETVDLRAYEYKQMDRIFRSVTSSDLASCYAVLTSSTPGGSFLAYGSVVDNRSGDPVFVPAAETPGE